MLTPFVIKMLWVVPFLLLSTAGIFVGISMVFAGVVHCREPNRSILARHSASVRPLLRPLLIARWYRRSRVCVFLMSITRALAVSAVVMSIFAAIISLAHIL